ncbi:formin-binding protein 1-like isoform X2 [Lingula anatina]|uniref:Formin-binding protein 1-like isoform X2 n=1 Tax=Lingula anatina TaxID=7574 RepID=A0A1S3HUM5_LINAN|nr:formin-binding protein 1-like isoform X2 [Lingula anatina]|eukprot:XP_013389246.1 formin-binding protein 1-like isoform X2 [Lingula anatina]
MIPGRSDVILVPMKPSSLLRQMKDQYDNVASHTQKGIDFCERFGQFVKERCQIEVKYAGELKKLVKKYQPANKKEDEESAFSVVQGFLAMLKEVHDIAGQHELISENMASSVIKEVLSLAHEVKQERKKHLQEAQKLQQQLNLSIQQLDKCKGKYEKAFKEMEKAVDNYKRADADINLSRAEVEKHKNTSHIKTQQCDELKNDYAAQLQTTNKHQQEHYTVLMPQVFSQLQEMDEKRITELQRFIKECGDIERNVIPIINTCIDGIHNAANSVNPSKDSELVIEKYKSGFQAPGDIPFEDLNQVFHGSDSSLNSSKSSTVNVSRTETFKGGTVSGKNKKRGGLFGIFSSSKIIGFLTDETKEDFSNLPPTQRKKKLNKKIEELRIAIAKETAERDGMIKMQEVYQQNPALGDASSLDKQLEENAQKLDLLRQECQKFEGYLAEAEGQGTPQSDRKKRNSMTDESVTSRSTSDLGSMGSQQRASAPGTPLQQHQSYNESPDSGIQGNSRGQFDAQDSFEEDVPEGVPVLGVCVAVYPFEATNDGSVSMAQGEQFSIIETDQGDGWTLVRREATGEEGFVPTSYIEATYY